MAAPRCAALALLLLTSACVSPTPPLYYWGDYQGQLYASLKADGSADEQLVAMERLSVQAAGKGQALPPSFRGHMALLLLKLGRDAQAREMLMAEAEVFPESATFMKFLLSDKNKTKGGDQNKAKGSDQNRGKGSDQNKGNDTDVDDTNGRKREAKPFASRSSAGTSVRNDSRSATR